MIARISILELNLYTPNKTEFVSGQENRLWNTRAFLNNLNQMELWTSEPHIIPIV